MKKIFAVTAISFPAISAFAQVKFTVPSLKDLQKYHMASVELNGSDMIRINYARFTGKSVEEETRYTRDQNITT